MRFDAAALKKYIPAIALFVVFLIAALAIPFYKAAGCYWVSFLFCLLSVGAFAFVLYRDGMDERVESRYYRLPVIRVALLYVAAQMTLGFVFMGFAAVCPAPVPLVLFLLLAAAAAVGILFPAGAKKKTKSSGADDRDSTRRMRALTQDMATLAGRCADRDLSREIMELAGRFRESDPVTTSATVSAEDAIYAAVRRLNSAVAARDNASISVAVGEIDVLLEDRNRLCMAYRD
ncbi:MAG: hypothetical protein IK104_04475 [Clostridia bacterium]|nr:hypothetical protein [Clostridia bacterium]